MAQTEHGMFRRRIVAIADDGRCEAEIEDDYHHMRVWLTHDGGQVLSIDGAMLRLPWQVCSGAVMVLRQELTGMRLSTRIWDLPGSVHSKLHCTHMLDTALLCIAQAARGGARRYELRVPDRIDGRTRPHAVCNGAETFHFELDGDTITGPADMAGQNIRQMMGWARSHLDDDAMEALSMLRRAMVVARGRGMSSPSPDDLALILANMQGACFTFQQGRQQHLTETDNFRALSDHPERFMLDL